MSPFPRHQAVAPLAAATALACALGWAAPDAAAQGTNIALGAPVSASAATWGGQDPENITDGNLNNQSHPLASSGTLGFTYEVDLGSERNLGRLELVNRSGCCPERLSDYRVEIRADAGGSAGAVNWSADIRTDGSDSGDGGRDVLMPGLDPGRAMAGRYIRVINLSNEAYNPQIAELEAYEAPLPAIAFFSTDHGNITATGDPGLPASATLSWSVANAGSVSIDGGIGAVPLVGQIAVTPSVTTTYVLTATNAAGAITASVTVGVDQPVIPPRLTEFMADNAATLDDQTGASPDWIEIHNPNAFDLSMEGYFLTDRADDLVRWRFPAVTAPAGGYLVVFASGDDTFEPGEPAHTNFQLAKGGEYLALVDTDGATVLTEFAPGYPAQKEDVSYGFEPGGTAGYFDPPSPGATNGASFAGFVEDTKFSVRRGFYQSPQTVAITTLTEGATVRYTTDGSAPSPTHGSVYSAPLTISATTVLRAMAHKPGLAPTNIDTNTYVFVDDVITSPEIGEPVSQLMRDSLTAVPSMSIVTPNSINDTSEVASSFEMIHPDGTEGFQEDCGVKRFGGAFTNFDKKNFRLYFRSRYGAAKLNYPLFEGFDRGIPAAESFDQLNLRGGSHDMQARGFYMSNRFTDDTMLDMGNINPHGRFVHLYINGDYWGVYHLRERWSASTLTEYLGGPKSAHEAINGNWNVGGWADPVAPAYDGDGSAWARIKDLALTPDPGNYEALRPYLDMPHYIDYMIMWMFGNSEDEYRCVGPAGVGSGFKWFLNDADGYLRSAGNRTGFASATPGVFGRDPGDGPGSLFSLLFKAGDPDYRTLLADRIHKHYTNGGAMTPERTVARLAERCAEMDLPFRAEAARWGYRSHADWTNQKNNALNNILPGRTASALNQFRGAGFYPGTAAPVFSQHGGAVPAGFNLTMDAFDGTAYYTTDGSDPRLPGGALNPAARVFEGGTTTATAVPEGATWRYLDDGSDQGSGWRAVAFDDSAWASGPAELGYGEGDEATSVLWGPSASSKFVTTYFRHTFAIADATPLIGAQLRLKRDDGALVYLNGTEVARSSMPPGAVDFQTYANSASDDGDTFHAFSIPAERFLTGANTLAVEVHQSAPNSSDLSFDLELKVSAVAGGNSALAMSGNTLVRARALDGGEWSALNEAFFTVGGAAPVGPGEIVFSEIHYNPPGPDDAEFIELHNVSGHAVNLRGCVFGDGVEFFFADNRDIPLPPDGRALVVGSQFGIDAAYGLGLPVVGVYRGGLNNGGETVTLLAPDGETVIYSATYDGADPWPEDADGDGRSLVLADAAAPDLASSWRPSPEPGGSPGSGEGSPFSGDPDADLDGDGLSAFAEHALGTSDLDPNAGPGALRFGGDGAGGWILHLPLSLTATDTRAVLEFSSDMQTWDADPGAAELLSSGVDGDGRWLLRYRSPAAISGDRQFVRARFE